MTKSNVEKLTIVMDRSMEDGCIAQEVKGKLCKKQQNFTKKWTKSDF